MLVLDQLDQLVGSDAGLVAQGKALREKLDEAEFQGISDQPKGSQYWLQICQSPCREVSRENGTERRGDSLESHSSLDITTQVHHLPRNGRDERMRRVLLGKVVSRDGQDDVPALCGFRDAKDGTTEEDTVFTRRCEAFKFARGGWEDLLRSALLFLDEAYGAGIDEDCSTATSAWLDTVACVVLVLSDRQLTPKGSPKK